MYSLAYKEYLEIFSRYKKDTVPVFKITTAFAVVAAILFLSSLSLVNLQNSQSQPVRNEVSYLENTNASFFKAQQSIDDLLNSFQVAGAKVEKIDELKESTATPGYFTTLGETQKTIAKIKTTKESIENEKRSTENQNAPAIYSSLDLQLREYFDEAIVFTKDLEKKHTDLKDLLIAAGPSFYLPVLSDETIWQTQDPEKIKVYYEKKRTDAQQSMLEFAKVPTDPELKEFKDTQISYYQLLINVSDNILKVLNKEAATADEAVSNVEEAYQVLVGAKRENEVIAQNLFNERTRLTSSEKFFSDINSLKNRKNIIESSFAAGNTKTIEKSRAKSTLDAIKELDLPEIIRSLQSS